MRKTYNQLNRELLSKTRGEKKLKERVRTLRGELLEYRRNEKRAIIQYERIIKEWRKRYDSLFNNTFKLVISRIIAWYNEKRGIKNL